MSTGGKPDAVVTRPSQLRNVFAQDYDEEYDFYDFERRIRARRKKQSAEQRAGFIWGAKTDWGVGSIGLGADRMAKESRSIHADALDGWKSSKRPGTSDASPTRPRRDRKRPHTAHVNAYEQQKALERERKAALEHELEVRKGELKMLRVAQRNNHARLLRKREETHKALQQRLRLEYKTMYATPQLSSTDDGSQGRPTHLPPYSGGSKLVDVVAGRRRDSPPPRPLSPTFQHQLEERRAIVRAIKEKNVEKERLRAQERQRGAAMHLQEAQEQRKHQRYNNLRALERVEKKNHEIAEEFRKAAKTNLQLVRSKRKQDLMSKADAAKKIREEEEELIALRPIVSGQSSPIVSCGASPRTLMGVSPKGSVVAAVRLLAGARQASPVSTTASPPPVPSLRSPTVVVIPPSSLPKRHSPVDQPM